MTSPAWTGGMSPSRTARASLFVFEIAIVALWLGTAWRMRIPGESAERIFPWAQGPIRITVYPDSFDTGTARKLIEGEN
jgi:hypothetical protein